MVQALSDLALFYPETALVAFLVFLFIVDGFLPSSRTDQFPLFIVIVGCVLASVLTYKTSMEPKTYFSGLVASDGVAHFFRYVFFLACGVSAYAGLGSKEVDQKGRNEFLILLLCVTFGMSLMAIANHLLILYIGIETVSIISFALAGFSRESIRSNEAAFKYLVFGALASGLMIYGISLVYGYAGSLQYQEIGKFLVSTNGQQPYLLLFALALVYAGFAYKISSFPFHFWTPDVYEGAPTPVVTFFSVGPKAAGFAAIMRFVLDVLAVKGGDGTWKAIEGLALPQTLALISAATMIVGNLSAIGQTNVKRILAYSSIAHVGYMLMGLVTMQTAGLSAILFYIVAYCLMNIGAFWVVSIVADWKDDEDLAAFSGAGWRNPFLGTCMAIFLFSLTGIPMFSGFIGKFLLFGAVIKSQGYLWLAVVGVLNSVVALYYYVKILKAMWLEAPEGTERVAIPLYQSFGLFVLAVPTIVLGVYFTPVIKFVEQALASML